MSTARGTAMKLALEGEAVTWPATHYVFIEKAGPFQETAPQAWQSLHRLVPAISEHNTVTGYMSLYKIAPQIYRAGVALSEPPQALPEGLAYEHFPGGKYTKFVLTGPYSDLPEACGRVFRAVAERKLATRDDFGIENYVSDPRSTAPEELVTEILVPTT